RPLTDFGGKTSIFSHPVYLFLREFSLQDFRGGSNRIDTAEQFIDKVASSSSITGKPYIVKIPGKSDENAQPFLHALIAQTDKTVPAEGN
ncbi:DUF5329 family protein, partial [Escherichia coli]|uniref:DUF5329 family protein n=1 Tax=Escherichia coli TaxID=562 RepID=UPI0020221A75